MREWSEQWAFIQTMGVGTVIDIGANEGHFSAMIRRLLPEAKIVAFEPLPSCFAVLAATAHRLGNMQCHNLALGHACGTMDLFESSNAPSSSLLRMSDLHKTEWPLSAVNTPVPVSVSTLDSIVEIGTLTPAVAVKVDVQGFEDRVISGGTRVLGGCSLAVIETSFYSLYQSEALFPTVYEQMKRLGFVYHGSIASTRSKRDGKILQEDSLFLRE